jgi:hypothetical protein
MQETQNWFAGVDWASQKHDVWIADASGKRLGKRAFAHSGEGLAQNVRLAHRDKRRQA